MKMLAFVAKTNNTQKQNADLMVDSIFSVRMSEYFFPAVFCHISATRVWNRVGAVKIEVGLPVCEVDATTAHKLQNSAKLALNLCQFTKASLSPYNVLFWWLFDALYWSQI